MRQDNRKGTQRALLNPGFIKTLFRNQFGNICEDLKMIIYFGSVTSVLKILSKDMISNRKIPLCIHDRKKKWKYLKGQKLETG